MSAPFFLFVRFYMIHRYTQNGLNFLLDVNSGAVHLLDDVAYAVSGLISSPMAEICPETVFSALSGDYSRDDITAAYADLLDLYENGLLFSSDDYIDLDKIPIRGDTPIKALCLHVSHDCNLRCRYCFASTGDFGTGRLIMSPETAKKAIDFVISKSGSRRNIEIDFFGGEPLMAFETVKATVEYAKEKGREHGKNFRFTITTNGMLLDDDKIDYINREMSNVVLSLDGRKEINDAMRKTPSGAGSYDIIVPKFKKLVDARDKDKDYYIRGTFTRRNLDFSNDIMSIANEGFKHISVEPVVSEDGCGYELREEDLAEIFSEYDRLCEIMLKEHRKDDGFNFFHFNIDLEQGPCVIKRLRGCGAGHEYVAITPEGDIYPCHQFVGNEDFKMGSLDQGILRHDISDTFSHMNVLEREGCKDCWAKFYCSGGCSAGNYNMNKDIRIPYKLACELEKKRVECAIYLKAAEAGE